MNFQGTKACSEPRSTWMENKTDGKSSTVWSWVFFFFPNNFFLPVILRFPPCAKYLLCNEFLSCVCPVELEVSSTTVCSHQQLTWEGQGLQTAQKISGVFFRFLILSCKILFYRAWGIGTLGIHQAKIPCLGKVLQPCCNLIFFFPEMLQFPREQELVF